MKPLPMLLACLALSALVAGLTVSLSSSPSVEGASAGGAGTASLERLERELAELRELLEQLGRASEVRTPGTAVRQPVGELEATVRRMVAEELSRRSAARVARTDAEGEFDVDATLSEILELRRSGASFPELQEMWAELREAGKTDELVAALEEHAALNPQDPEAQLLLGSAYIARLQEAPQGPEMGEWAMKADGAFDAALELDENNWEARLSKAVSLSFWPPIFGKQGEAIGEFERLLEQQKNAPPSPDHAQTFQYLGNLYQQQGDAEKAREVWSRGLAQFPEDEELRQRLAAGRAD